MQRVFVYLLVAIAAACTSESPTPNVTQTATSESPQSNATAVWLDEHPMRYPRWISYFPTSCERQCNFPREECVFVSQSYFATLTPEEDTRRFLWGMTIEIDGELVPQSNLLIVSALDNLSPVTICFDTSQLEVGLHFATIRLPIENQLDEMYSWAFEVETVAP